MNNEPQRNEGEPKRRKRMWREDLKSIAFQPNCMLQFTQKLGLHNIQTESVTIRGKTWLSCLQSFTVSPLTQILWSLASHTKAISRMSAVYIPPRQSEIYLYFNTLKQYWGSHTHVEVKKSFQCVYLCWEHRAHPRQKYLFNLCLTLKNYLNICESLCLLVTGMMQQE